MFWNEFSFPVGWGAESFRGPSSAPIWQQNWISQHNQHPTPVRFSPIKLTHLSNSPQPSIHTSFLTQVQHPPGGGARRPLQHLLLSAHSNIFLHLCRLRPPGFHIVSVSEAFYQHIFICLYSLPAGGLSECLVPYKVRVEDTMSQFKWWLWWYLGWR